MKNSVLYIIVAAALWAFMFSSKTADIVPFWYAMLGATGILILLSFRHIKWEKPLPKDVCLGIVSAIVLWGIFWVGNYFSTRWFGFAAQNIQSIYNIKSDFNPLFLSLILLFWIGPAEEIFWRGFLQRQWSEKLGANLGFVLTAVLYAGVHIVSLNFMLVMAALVCGIFWGLIYKYTNRLWPVIISHALWDCAVFLWFPIS